jgi:cobalt-precorrin-5B (C1)-methyltransferase
MNTNFGYTTGTCAAAAAKASLKMLLIQKEIKNISLVIPAGIRIRLKIHDSNISKECVSCAVIKYSGKDPDVTNGTKIFAKARLVNENKIFIIAGKGIGVVTKKGLPVSVGLPAINPVPMKMILSEIKKLKPLEKGVEVELTVPDGEELAKKTFNSKLGIIGGISIIGTTGIVKPMSTEAIKKTIELRLKVLKEQGDDLAVLTLGNYGEKFLIKNFDITEEKIVQVSNYIGFSVKKSERIGFKKIILAGHFGKLIKIKEGIFNTHSSVSDSGIQILSESYLDFTNDAATAKKILFSNTVEEAVNYIGNNKFFDFIAEEISMKLKELVNEMEIGVIIFSNGKGLLAESKSVKNILKKN